jgi:hypothetical protein
MLKVLRYRGVNNYAYNFNEKIIVFAEQITRLIIRKTLNRRTQKKFGTEFNPGTLADFRARAE